MDELNYFKDLFANFGQATTLIIAYMVFKLSVGGFITFGVNQSIKALVKLWGTDVPKSQLDQIYADNKRKIEDIERELSCARKEAAEKQAELERVIHIYKIMKEAKENEPAISIITE
jgi:hypothetical protein